MLINAEVIKVLGLALNEAKIYETLLKEGESTAAHVSKVSRINRRNVYDSVKRLQDKGLVFEILQGREIRYQAVDPNKLREILGEGQRALDAVLPQLSTLYESKGSKEQVYIYRGIEGVKNYMRDIIRVGKDYYAIGAKSMWTSPELKTFMKWFLPEARQKKINFYCLYDHEVKGRHHEITGYIGNNYRFLPPSCSTDTAVNIFGDHVVNFSKMRLFNVDQEMTLTVIINPLVAEGYRSWFKFMWDACPAN